MKEIEETPCPCIEFIGNYLAFCRLIQLGAEWFYIVFTLDTRNS